MKQFVFVLVLGALLLSACGPATPEPTPTMSIADIQATSVNMVWTMVAQTQAAMPTNTPVPTETPAARPTRTPKSQPTGDSLLTTPLALPTLAPPTAASGGGGGDPCNRILSTWVGKSTKLLIENQIKGDVTISLFIRSNRGGECGYKSFVLGTSVSTDLPELSCFTAFAWVKTKKKEFTISSNGAYCTNNTDKYTLVLMDRGMKFVGP